MTASYTPAERDRAFAFIVTGIYTNDKRLPSAELSQSIAQALAANFAVPEAINSYVLPRFKMPLAYDLRTVWTGLTPFDRNHIREISPELFNALSLFLTAVPEESHSAPDESGASVRGVAAPNSAQAISDSATLYG